MDRIYSEQIEKAMMLAEGLKKNSDALKAKGFDLSVIEEFERDCEEMAREGEAIEKEQEALAQHRIACHTILSRLKTNFFNSKGFIKQNFEQEQWNKYGVPDKR